MANGKKGNYGPVDPFAKSAEEEEIRKYNELKAKEDARARLAQERRIGLLEQEVALAKELHSQESEAVKKQELKLELLEAEKRALIEINGAHSDEVVAIQKKIDAQKKSLAALGQIEGKTADLVQRLTGVSDIWGNSILKNIWDAKGGVAEFGKSISKSLSLTNILSSTMAKVKESSMAAGISFDQGRAELAALTGTGLKYGKQMIDVSDANRKFGVGIGRSAKILGELHTNMLGFTDLSDTAQNDLAGLAGKFENLGISVSETGVLMDDMMKGFGLSSDEAQDSMKGIVNAALSLNIPPSQMIKSYKATLPKLAHWGKDAEKIFLKVAGAAKQMGIEASALLDVAGQFDTFEGAASAVGKLNAVLGHDLLNTYEMIGISEEERIAKILESTEASGYHWKDLTGAQGKYIKQTIMNAAGIKDMETANKMFMYGAEGYKRHIEGSKKTAAEMKVIEDRSKVTLDVQKKMAMIMENLAILFAPVVNYLHQFLDGLLKNDRATKDLAWQIGGLLAVLWATGKAIWVLTHLTRIWSGVELVGQGIAKAWTGIKKAHLAITKLIIPVNALHAASTWSVIAPYVVGIVMIGAFIYMLLKLFGVIKGGASSAFGSLKDSMSSVTDALPSMPNLEGSATMNMNTNTLDTVTQKRNEINGNNYGANQYAADNQRQLGTKEELVLQNIILELDGKKLIDSTFKSIMKKVDSALEKRHAVSVNVVSENSQ